MNTREAFNYCEYLAKKHYENFPVASIIVPKNKRKYIFSIYAFSRIADDYADEDKYKSNRLELLNDWEDKLEKCYEGHNDHPVFIALFETIKKFNLPKQLFLDLLHAFKMDVSVKRYKNIEEVLSYCRYSANPIGRLMLSLFGYTDEKFHQLSDYICTALQLTNFWQDVAIDLAKDRVYLPLEDMEKFGYTLENLFDKRNTEAFCELMKHEIMMTREFFGKGAKLCYSINGFYGFELKLTWLGGMKVLNCIEKNNYDVFTKRSTLNIFDKGSILWKALIQFPKL